MFKLNEVTRRRLRAFKRRKSAYYSFWALVVISAVGLGADLVANNEPYVMKYQGHYYFPIFKTYHPTEFGITDRFIVNYKKMEKRLGEKDWMIFPPIRWSPYESNRKAPEYPAPPSKTNLLGTDDRGRDVLTRLIYGYRVSMAYAFSVWVVSYLIGITLGGIMGYFGGRMDFLMQRGIEMFTAIPYFFLLIILISIFQPGILLLACLASIFGWVAISYYIRAEFLKFRKFEFVEACRALGMRTPKVLFKHILPNALTPIVTFSPIFIATEISELAGLDYLGFGVAPPTASWGELLNQGKQYFNIAWWLAVFPAVSLFITLTLLNLVGEGVRNAFDPSKT